MTTHTHYLWFETKKRQEIIDITDEVEEQVRASAETTTTAHSPHLWASSPPRSLVGDRVTD